MTLQLYAVPGDYAINTPYVVEGRLPESSREIVLSDTLAGARGLHPGDWYELTLTGTGRTCGYGSADWSKTRSASTM